MFVLGHSTLPNGTLDTSSHLLGTACTKLYTAKRKKCPRPSTYNSNTTGIINTKTGELSPSFGLSWAATCRGVQRATAQIDG